MRFEKVFFIDKRMRGKILSKISPSPKDIKEENLLVEDLIHKIKSVEGKHVGCLLAGSMSRGTHLKNNRDVDLFIMFDKKISRKEFEKEGLRIGKEVFKGHKWEIAYSEHPYIRGNIKGFDVEIVPSYKIKDTTELQSAVDRTPFHTEYLLKNMKQKQKDEVRLLRQFLKTIKAYGSDLRTSSFSGYLVELMILNYGNFEKTIKEVSEWQLNQIIDLENFYSIEEYNDLKKKFESPLIVIDPIDKSRNVAAALSLNQFSRFMAAARQYLKKPSDKFFFGKKTKPFNPSKIKDYFDKKDIIAVELGLPKGIIDDILWGQLRKLRKQLASHLSEMDFKVLRGSEWISQESNTMYIILEFENEVIQKIHKRIGPMVVLEQHSMKFLESHKKISSGPRIEDGRWVIEVERKYSDAKNFIKDYLKKVKRQGKPGLKKALNKRSRILSEKQLLALYKKNKGFREFFTVYLKGREEFLDF